MANHKKKKINKTKKPEKKISSEDMEFICTTKNKPKTSDKEGELIKKSAWYLEKFMETKQISIDRADEIRKLQAEYKEIKEKNEHLRLEIRRNDIKTKEQDAEIAELKFALKREREQTIFPYTKMVDNGTQISIIRTCPDSASLATINPLLDTLFSELN